MASGLVRQQYPFTTAVLSWQTRLAFKQALRTSISLQRESGLCLEPIPWRNCPSPIAFSLNIGGSLPASTTTAPIPEPFTPGTYAFTLVATSSTNVVLDVFEGGVVQIGSGLVTYKWIFEGEAAGGLVSSTINGCVAITPTTAGQEAATVASNFASAVNANGCLTAQGIAATSSGRTVSVAGPVDVVATDTTITDPGLQYPIILEKKTNGQDADQPTGPVLSPGSAVEWTYSITNGSSRQCLLDVILTDSVLGSLSCEEGPIPNLDPEDSFVCTISGTAESGLHSNLGRVVASAHPSTAGGAPGAQTGLRVEATDLSHYLGQEPPTPTHHSNSDDDSHASSARGYLVLLASWCFRVPGGGKNQ